jgi:hypothetical protein
MPKSGYAAKVGATLALLWGLLHILIPMKGIQSFFNGGARDQINMFIGGEMAPFHAYKHSPDKVTQFVQSSLLLTFVLNLGGYGLLGIYLASKIFFDGSWEAYFLWLMIIGIPEFAYVFFLLLPGIISINLKSLVGPFLWLFAAMITPFGLPSLFAKSYEKKAK